MKTASPLRDWPFFLRMPGNADRVLQQAGYFASALHYEAHSPELPENVRDFM